MIKGFGGGILGNAVVGNIVMNEVQRNIDQITNQTISEPELMNRIVAVLQAQNPPIKADAEVTTFIDSAIKKYKDFETENLTKVDRLKKVLFNPPTAGGMGFANNEQVAQHIAGLDEDGKNDFYKQLSRSVTGSDKGFAREIRNIIGTRKNIIGLDTKNIVSKMFQDEYTLFKGDLLSNALGREIKDPQLFATLSMVNYNRKNDIATKMQNDPNAVAKAEDKEKKAIREILRMFNFDANRYGLPYAGYGGSSNTVFNRVNPQGIKGVKSYELYWELLGFPTPPKEVLEVAKMFPQGIPSSTMSLGKTPEQIQQDEQIVREKTKTIRYLLPMKRKADEEVLMMKIAYGLEISEILESINNKMKKFCSGKIVDTIDDYRRYIIKDIYEEI